MAGLDEEDWLPRDGTHELKPRATRTGEAAAGGFALRPLSLGEVLDRTFALYRSRFWLFASIAAIAAAVQVAVQAISLTTVHALLRSAPLYGAGQPARAGALGELLQAQAGAYLAALVYFLVAAVTQAATSLAMSEVYLGRPASAGAALRVALQRWYRWIGIALWQAGSFLWLPLLGLLPGLLLIGLGTRGGNRVLVGVGAVVLVAAVLGGFVGGLLFYLRNALAVPAAIVERLTIRPAMRRSRVLAAGAKGRIFVVLLIAGCLYTVVGVLESPASLLMLLAPKANHYLAVAITLVISFLGRTVVAPVALIGLTLVYFDQRVRKEALDLQLLLEASRASGGAVQAAPGQTVAGQAEGQAVL